MNKLNWILDRLGENSTWRGIVAILAAVGALSSPDSKQAIAIIAAGSAIVGLINVFRKAPPTAAVVADAINSGDTQFLTKPTATTPAEPPKP